MPNCGRIEDYAIEESQGSWIVTVSIHYSSLESGVEDMVLDAYASARSGGPGRLQLSDGEYHNRRYSISREKVERGELERFLYAMKGTVTISDDADESHALDFHRIPHPEIEPGIPNWHHTPTGELVESAKSYDLASGHQSVGMKLANKYLEWIQSHPRYKKARMVVSPPPSNPSKTFDLPSLVSKQLAQQLGLKIVSCTVNGEVVPQKSLRGDREAKLRNLQDKYYIADDLTDQVVLLIDDIYETGTTVNELVRACRVAGASRVLGLTATKTALEARGLSASRWYEAMYSGVETSS